MIDMGTFASSQLSATFSPEKGLFVRKKIFFLRLVPLLGSHIQSKLHLQVIYLHLLIFYFIRIHVLFFFSI